MEQCQKRTVLSNDIRRNKKRKKKTTFLQKVYLKEKNCEKTRQRAKSITQETDEDELRQVEELMGSMSKGPVCESCIG